MWKDRVPLGQDRCMGRYRRGQDCLFGKKKDQKEKGGGGGEQRVVNQRRSSFNLKIKERGRKIQRKRKLIGGDRG